MSTNNFFAELAPGLRANVGNDARKRLKHCGANYFFKHAVAAEHGGNGDQYADLCFAHQRLGEICLDPGLILSINAHLWGALFPLLKYGSKDQQASLLSGLLSGEQIGGHAITEPQSGSDAGAILTNAVRSTAGFRLNGRKRYITNAPIADVLVVYAQHEKQLTAFLVKSSDPGAEFTDTPKLQACATAPIGEVLLNDCEVTEDRILGRLGGGAMLMQRALEFERAFIFAGIGGVMEWQLAKVIEHSRKRIVNGRPLGYNQAISHRIAAMRLRLDTVRLWIGHCADLCDRGKRITIASAETKLFAGEAFLQSSLDSAHIFGAAGLEEHSPFAAFINDAVAGRLFSGSSEVQKNIIAAALGTGESYRQ